MLYSIIMILLCMIKILFDFTIATICILATHTLIYQTTGISVYDELRKHLIYETY